MPSDPRTMLWRLPKVSKLHTCAYLMTYFIDRVKYAFVNSFIMFLGSASEDFCLHPGAYDPKGIGDDIAEKSADTC